MRTIILFRKYIPIDERTNRQLNSQTTHYASVLLNNGKDEISSNVFETRPKTIKLDYKFALDTVNDFEKNN